MRISRILLVCAGLALPVAVQAQNPPPEPARIANPTPAAIALSRELVTLMNLREAGLAGLRAAMNPAQFGSGPEAEAAIRVVEQWAMDLFGSEEALAGFSRVYAETFTEAELQEILVFYRTPAGRHLLAEQPYLTMRGAEIGRQLAMAHQADLMERLSRKAPPPAKSN
ncbi:MAG TPA: DUF2059 domain-containing protein [Longimicrobium sp.]|jgi:hypothetical protein|uniref:DUF2059 domain-containing protein n=1 Tax=Longimicrobium sp. TaxID=2029185 RepID=UPI002ED87913